MNQEGVDYCKYFVETGQRPQNLIRSDDMAERYQDQPKQQELMDLKAALLKVRNHPVMYLKQEISTFNIETLGKFDVIVVDPPWTEYKK